ncbi:MAG TPA: hypothetical protein VH593_29180 [Ktedonobacteraceae bacterium]|jgi:hypothetical protein
MINNSNLTFGPIVPTSPPANGPGGNPIVPTPATPSQWPKMLIAIVIVSGGIWFLSTFNEQYATWLAIITVGGMATYYELHNNHQFSNGISDLAKLIGQ